MFWIFDKKKRQEKDRIKSAEADEIVADSITLLEKAAKDVRKLNTAIKREDVILNLYNATHSRGKQK